MRYKALFQIIFSWLYFPVVYYEWICINFIKAKESFVLYNTTFILLSGPELHNKVAWLMHIKRDHFKNQKHSEYSEMAIKIKA